MKVFSAIAYGLIFTFLFAAISFAQIKDAESVKTGKVALIDSDVFHDPEKGIKEIVAADHKLEAEFNPEIYELQQATLPKLKALEKEFRDQRGREKPPILTKEQLESMVKDYESLSGKYKSKLEEIKSRYEKRRAETFEIIDRKVDRAAELFAKEKGYEKILRVSKLDQPLAFMNPENVEVTEEFIRFYKENFTQTETR